MQTEQLKRAEDLKLKGDFKVYHNYAYNKSSGFRDGDEEKKQVKDIVNKPPKYIYSQSVNLTYMIFMVILLVWTIFTSSFTM
jgi:hypothetical protein